MEATVAVVAEELRTIELPGLDLDVTEAPALGQLSARRAFRAGQ